MSEQPQPQEQTSRWGDDISRERQAELDARLQAWAQEADHDGHLSPFDGVPLTGADVFYLTAHALAGADGDVAQARVRLRDTSKAEIIGDLTVAGANLGGANLAGANLSGAYLINADFMHANLAEAHLSEAILISANLTKANLSSTELPGAILISAILISANLAGANLAGANLSGANLIGANLGSALCANATFVGAYLQYCRLDAGTMLLNIALDTDTILGDVVWNGATLTQVDWGQVPRLGDEGLIREAETRADRIKAIHNAARAYRGLITVLRSQSMAHEASQYRLREQRLERHALRLERHYGGWFFSALLDLVSGYGEEPGRIFTAYLVVVLGFAAVYFGITNFSGSVFVTHSSVLQWYEALVLSLSSFHGRGFFPQSINLGDPVAMVAALEAVTGLFIELILIATFSKRFLAS